MEDGQQQGNHTKVNRPDNDRRTFLQQAASVGLTVATGSCGQAMAHLGHPVPSTEVRGSVVSGPNRTPLAGVRVSDGLRVVSTDASGEFRIRVGRDSGPFLFITTPSGHHCNSFYVTTANAVTTRPLFRLTPRSRDLSHRLVYMTDVHLGEGNAAESNRRMSQTIDEINSLDPLPDACWVGGDISLDHRQGPAYIKLVSRLKMPVKHSVGNHEFQLKTDDPLNRFRQLFGPTYYSWNTGRLHCITLDGCHLDSTPGKPPRVIGKFGRRELDWLAADLAAVPDHLTTVVAIHIPLASTFPKRMGTTAAKAPHWVIANGEQAIDQLARHDVKLVLQGHLHENQRMLQSGIEFVESISVCGRWWKAKSGDREVGTSGEPRGYRLVDSSSGRLAHRYVGSAESRVDAAGEIVGRPEKLDSDKAANLLVNIFDGTTTTQVAAQIDSRPQVILKPSNQGRHFGDLQAEHHWGWTIPALDLAPGRHQATIRIQEPGRPRQSFTHEFAS